MSDRTNLIAERIRAFVENPFTILLKGLVLLAIGLFEAMRTLREDLVHGQLRVGHGMIILGIFGVLASLPDLIEGLSAGTKYLDSKQMKIPNDPEKPGSPRS
jgi:hypothetical protein